MLRQDLMTHSDSPILYLHLAGIEDAELHGLFVELFVKDIFWTHIWHLKLWEFELSLSNCVHSIDDQLSCKHERSLVQFFREVREQRLDIRLYLLFAGYRHGGIDWYRPSFCLFGERMRVARCKSERASLERSFLRIRIHSIGIVKDVGIRDISEIWLFLVCLGLSNWRCLEFTRIALQLRMCGTQLESIAKLILLSRHFFLTNCGHQIWIGQNKNWKVMPLSSCFFCVQWDNYEAVKLDNFFCFTPSVPSLVMNRDHHGNLRSLQKRSQLEVCH